MMFPVYRGRAVQPGTAMTAHSDERSGAIPMPDLPSPAAHPTVLAMQTPCSRSKSTYALPHPPQTARRLDIEPLRLEAGKAIGDGLETLADGIEMVQSLCETEVGEVVGDQLVAQEGRELFVLFEEGALYPTDNLTQAV